MDRKTHARLFRHRHDGPQEDRHVFPQLRFIDVAILSQTRAELVEGVALFCPRQAGDNVAGQLFNISFAGGVEPHLRLLLLCRGVICRRAFALQDVQLERGKGDLVKTQRF